MFRVIFKPFKIRACLKYSYNSNTANFEVRYFTLYLLYKGALMARKKPTFYPISAFCCLGTGQSTIG